MDKITVEDQSVNLPSESTPTETPPTAQALVPMGTVTKIAEMAASKAIEEALKMRVQATVDDATVAYRKALGKTMTKIANQQAFIQGALWRESTDKDTGVVTLLHADGRTIVVRPKK